MINEKRETAIKWLKNEIRSLRLAPTINGCGPENWADLLEIMQTCLEAVSGYFVVVNKTSPLKLDQLREMNGNPVWVEFEDGSGGLWGIVHISVFEQIVFPDGLHCTIGQPYYGKIYKAYAYPTAHIDREAWTAEWRELHGDKMVGLDDCGEDVYRHYHYSVCTSCGKGTAVKSNFCPSCGRAMTPEAWAELEKRLRG